VVGFVAVLLVAAGACASGPDRSAVIGALTDQTIVPAYQASAREMDVLYGALEELCRSRSTSTLDGARRAWRSARAAWLRTRATPFGPSASRRSVTLIDWMSVDREGIERLANGATAVDAEAVREILGSNQRGLGAVEQLLFDPDAPQKVSTSSNRCLYLVAMGRVLRDETAAIVEEWTVQRPSGAPYAAYLAGRAPISVEAGAAVADLVRAQVFLARSTVMQLAEAQGLREGTTAQGSAPGALASNQIADLRAQVEGMQRVYMGPAEDGSLGLTAIVAARSRDTDLRVRQAIDGSLAALDGIEGPLRDAVAQRPDQVRRAYDGLTELNRVLGADLVGLLNVSVGFSDTDGDSSR
jgi:predicted lipoprotein